MDVVHLSQVPLFSERHQAGGGGTLPYPPTALADISIPFFQGESVPMKLSLWTSSHTAFDGYIYAFEHFGTPSGMSDG